MGNAHSVLRRDEMVDALSIFGNGELNALDDSIELVASRPVVRRDGRFRVHSHIASIIGREDDSRGGANIDLADFLPST
jgi:hypothetical protein